MCGRIEYPSERNAPAHLVSTAERAQARMHARLLDLADPLEPCWVSKTLVTWRGDVVGDASLSSDDAACAGNEVHLAAGDDATEDREAVVC